MAIAKKLKQKTRQFIDSKHMLKSITVASFLESTIVPIPLEAVLVPLMQARREKLWLIALNPEQFEQVKQKMQAQGFWFVLTLGIVPIPFQIAMLAAGATKYSIFLFLLATVIARSIRYFALAAVVYYAGNQAERVIQKHKTKALVAISVLVLLLWWLSTLI